MPSERDLVFMTGILQGFSLDIEQADYQEMINNTPRRFLKALEELTTREEFTFTTFPKEAGLDELIAVTNIQFVSLCSHHLFPFIGKAHVAYVPALKVAGLSKLVRTVQYYSKGLWIQEKLTDRIVDRIQEELDPIGVAVILQAEHLCYTIRGAQAPGTTTTTSAMKGAFLDPTKKARDEFFEIIKLANTSR
jgi:GTP cyclohydrolase I